MIMKKSFLFFALLASIAMLTGCKKDQDVLTLQAVIDQDTKAYFGTTTQPYWDSDDQVCVAGARVVTGEPNSLVFSETLPLSNTDGTFAKIHVPEASDVYCAIYANEVERMGIPSASASEATIYFDPHQLYKEETVGNVTRQRVNMPMGAVTTGNTLYFKNLCSILRVNINRNLAGYDFDVKRITVQAFGAYIAGSADVTLSTAGVTSITMTGELDDDDDNVISFYAPGHVSMGSINSSNPTLSYDIVVPPIDDAAYIVIEVELSDPNTNTLIAYSSHAYGGTSSADRVHLDRNQIITINLGTSGTNEIHNPDYAYLEPGSGETGFNQDIRALIGTRNVTSISINTSYSPSDLPNPNADYSLPSITTLDNDLGVEGWVEVQDVNSPIKIYAHLRPILSEATNSPTYDESGRQIYTVEVVSSGTYIYANADCSMLFKDITTLKSVQWITSATSGFQTEDVTDMSYMFAGCTQLNNVQGLTSLNTTNVTNMSHMFEGCKFLTLNLTGLNTHNLRNTEAMFQNCRSLGGLTLGSFNMDRITNKTNMCKNISADKNWEPSCDLSCTESVQTALLEKRYVATNNDPDNPGIEYYDDVNDEDEDSNTQYYYYTTGIKPIKITWHTSK